MSKSMLQRRVTYVGTLMAAVLSVGVMSTAGATYNSNIVGTPTSVIAYEGGNILFTLDTQPTSNGVCDAGYFEIDLANNTDAVLDRMYKRLLIAYTQKQPVQIGYDNSDTCGSFHHIHVYRVG
jgi:hypothetical protein